MTPTARLTAASAALTIEASSPAALVMDRYFDGMEADGLALGWDHESVVAARRFAMSDEFPKVVARVTAARLKALGIDLRVKAVREHATVGRWSCSVIDETYSDAELAEALDKARIRSASGAVKWALGVHSSYHARWA
jgi:hypothetical protein